MYLVITFRDGDVKYFVCNSIDYMAGFSGTSNSEIFNALSTSGIFELKRDNSTVLIMHWAREFVSVYPTIRDETSESASMQ